MVSTEYLVQLGEAGLSCPQIAERVGMKRVTVWARLNRWKKGYRINTGRFKPKYEPIQIGEKFGLWTVIEKGTFRHNQQRWITECKCGNRGEVAQQHLRGGKSTRCVVCAGHKLSEEAAIRSKGMHCSNRRIPRVKSEIEILYETQGGKCLLCGKQFESIKEAAWDHDHSTGKGRGLLHRGCNVFLGFIERDPEILTRVKDYCERYGIL